MTVALASTKRRKMILFGIALVLWGCHVRSTAVMTPSPSACPAQATSVSGKVTDQNDKGVPRISVVLRRTAKSMQEFYGTASNDTGYFYLELPHIDGDELLLVNTDGFKEISGFDRDLGFLSDTISLASIGFHQTVRLRSNALSLTGRVVGPNSAPIADALVVLMNNGSGVSTLTDSLGNFVANHVREGTYSASVFHERYIARDFATVDVPFQKSQILTLQVPRAVQPCKAFGATLRPGELVGVVLDKQRRFRLPFASIILTGANDGVDTRIVADSLGCFFASGMKAQQYAATTSYVGYERGQEIFGMSRDSGQLLTISLAQKDTMAVLDEFLLKDAVRGSIVDGFSGKPISGATILLGPKPTWFIADWRAYSDSLGAFSFGAVPNRGYFAKVACGSTEVTQTIQANSSLVKITLELIR